MKTDVSNMIYFADITPLNNEEIFQHLYAKLPESRKKKINRLKNRKEQLRSLGAGALLGVALSSLGIPQQKACFTIGEHGKPFLSDYPEIHFNLSHAGTKVMCGIASLEIGCDIEAVSSCNPMLATRFFSQREAESVMHQPTEHGQKETFCKLWTLKESYLKTTGTGFFTSPNTFSFCLDKEKIYLEQAENAQMFHFIQMAPFEGYFASVCLKSNEQPSVPTSTIIDFEELVRKETAEKMKR